jgi:hypothetical protein
MSLKRLDVLYWILTLTVAGALFVQMYSVAAFFVFLSLTIQLSEIATYLRSLLVIQQEKFKDVA